MTVEHTPELLGIGNALVDVVAVLEEESAPLLGLHPNRSVHVTYERLSEILIALDQAAIGAGGGAATVAKIASLLGLRTAFAGCIGGGALGHCDRFGEIFREELEDAGVQVLLSVGKEPTGACAILRMPGGLSAIAACPSAALGLTASDLPFDMIRSAKIVMLDGFILDRKELVQEAVRVAAESGTVTALDVASPSIVSENAAFIADLAIHYPLILFFNEAEAQAYCGALGSSSDDAEDGGDAFKVIAAQCADGPFPVAVVKRGPKGVLVFAAGERYGNASRAITPCDETGAGDAFAAGFLSAWLRGKDLSACAELGNRIARAIIKIPGTRLDAEKTRRLGRGLL